METFTVTLKQCCQTQLNNLKARLPETQWAVVATADGHVVASTAKAAANCDRIPEVAIDTFRTEAGSAATQKESAMASALNGLSLSIARELALGSMESIVVECSQARVFCLRVLSREMELVLFSTVSTKASYGQALWSVKTTARELATALS